MKVLSLFLIIQLTLGFCQQQRSPINYYWQSGQQTVSKDMNPQTFYLTLINESFSDSISNKHTDLKIHELLHGYKFSIQHQGFSDDEIGDVFYRKLQFEKLSLNNDKLKKLYEKVYSYDQVEFFGPLIHDLNNNHTGAGLYPRLDITFLPKTSQEEIQRVVEKYQLNIYSEHSSYQEDSRTKLTDGGIYTTSLEVKSLTVFFRDSYGLNIISHSSAIQAEPAVAYVTNHLQIQVTF